jgi:hypothetical protein
MRQFARLTILVLRFAEWSQSVHPHRHFIFEYVSFMKATGRTEHQDFARFLDLQKLQSNESKGFYLLFKKFRKFADPNMKCSEPKERSLLCFFDLMCLVFSNDHFLYELQELRKDLERALISWEGPKFLSNPELMPNFISKVIAGIMYLFLQRLQRCLQLQTLIQEISYFRRTNCADCHEFLDPDNNDGLCLGCKSQLTKDEELEFWEER